MTDLVERYFDGAAVLYDDATSTDEAWSMPRHVADVLASLDGDLGSGLAIGAGTGYDVDLLKARGVRDIVMLDISRRMLDAAALRHPEIPQVHADIMNKDSINGHYDVVISIGVLEFIEDAIGFLQRCSSLLCPAGSLIVTYEPVIKGYPPQEAHSELIHSREQDPSYDCDGVIIHRIDVGDFAEFCAKVGLELVSHTLVLAYVDEASTFYGLVHLRPAQ